MDIKKFKNVTEAEAFARAFIQKHRLRTSDAVDVARNWYTAGDYNEDWRATLTAENLNSKLESAFLVKAQ